MTTYTTRVVVPADRRITVELPEDMPLGEAEVPLFDAFFLDTPPTRVGLSAFQHATRLRADHNLKTPGALHIGAAITGGCAEFWTNDHRLDSVHSRSPSVSSKSSPARAAGPGPNRKCLATTPTRTRSIRANHGGMTWTRKSKPCST
jgi:predicted nucleic acid-binding protein